MAAPDAPAPAAFPSLLVEFSPSGWGPTEGNVPAQVCRPGPCSRARRRRAWRELRAPRGCAPRPAAPADPHSAPQFAKLPFMIFHRSERLGKAADFGAYMKPGASEWCTHPDFASALALSRAARAHTRFFHLQGADLDGEAVRRTWTSLTALTTATATLRWWTLRRAPSGRWGTRGRTAAGAAARPRPAPVAGRTSCPTSRRRRASAPHSTRNTTSSRRRGTTASSVPPSGPCASASRPSRLTPTGCCWSRLSWGS